MKGYDEGRWTKETLRIGLDTQMSLKALESQMHSVIQWHENLNHHVQSQLSKPSRDHPGAGLSDLISVVIIGRDLEYPGSNFPNSNISQSFI